MRTKNKSNILKRSDARKMEQQMRSHAARRQAAVRPPVDKGRGGRIG
jgi:hypothetical protein